jgi:hypothetical protein
MDETSEALIDFKKIIINGQDFLWPRDFEFRLYLLSLIESKYLNIVGTCFR